MFLTQPIHKGARERPAVAATVFGNTRRSFAQQAERVSRIAGMMQALGVGAGDRVAMLSLNSVHYLESLFGCWWAGAVVAPLNVRWSAVELAYGLEDSGARVLLADTQHVAIARDLAKASTRPLTVIHVGAARPDDHVLDYEELLTQAQPVPDTRRGGDALAALLYTDGTTGKSKGVMLSHDNLAIDVLGTLEAAFRGDDPVVLHCAPMFHVGGIAFALQAAFRQATQVIVPAFDPEAVLRLIQAERATEIFLVPTMIRKLIEYPDFSRHDLTSLRTLIYGAAPIDSTLLDQAMAVLPRASFIQVYGQTETGPVLTSLAPALHTPEGRKRDKLATAGTPIATAELRIVDPGGVEVATGQVGEICARGPTVMQGYWNKSEQTAQALRDGWLHTGDGGFLDADGFLHVVDRIKDMIITGGENVFSTEVEDALLKHPDVVQCAVIGVPDATWGERVHAVVVPRKQGALGAEELVRHCKSLIAGFKCPRSIEFRTELPLSAAGKLLKYQLREPHWAGRSRSVA